MAVAHDAVTEHPTGTVAHTLTTPQTFTHTPVGTPKGILVFTVSAFGGGGADIVTGVTYGGVAMASRAVVTDSAGEPGTSRAWFLGSGIPTGPQTVSIARDTSGVGTWAVCISVTAGVGMNTDIHDAGAVALSGDGAYTEQNANDGSPGTNSLRYAVAYYGGAAPPPVGANSTLLHDIDVGQSVAAACRETTAGQGARPVGFVQATADDRAAIHLAIKEVAAGGGAALTQDVNDTLALADALAFARGLAIADTLALADALSFERGLGLADTLALADALAFQRDLNIADAVALADAVSVNLGREISIADTLSLADSVFLETGKGVTINDTLALTDALSFDREIAVSDAVAMSDSLSFERALNLADNLALVDALAFDRSITITDLVALADSVDPQIGAPATAALKLRTLLGVGL